MSILSELPFQTQVLASHFVRAQSERFLNALLQHSFDAIAVIAVDGLILYGSPSTCQVLGYELMEFEGHNAFEFVHPDDHAAVTLSLTRSLQEPSVSVAVSARVRHQNGSWRWMEGIFTNLLDDPAVGGIVNNYRDFTERREYEHTLVESQTRLGGILESVSDAIISTGTDFRIITWNHAAEVMYGWNAEEVLGKSTLEILRTEYITGDLETVLREMKEKGNWRGEVIHHRKDGTGLWVFSSAAALKDSDGNVIGRVSVSRDVTERVLAQKKLQESNARLAALADLSNVLNTVGSEVNVILETIVQRVGELIGDACTVGLISEDGEWIDLIAMYHRDPEGNALLQRILKNRRVQVGVGVLGESARSGKPIFEPVSSPIDYIPLITVEQRLLLKNVTAYSRLVAPLRVKNKVIGIVSLTRTQPELAYTTDELSFLQDVADRTALAIENARLFDQVQHELEGRVVAEDEIRTLNAALEARVAERTAQLEAANKEMEAFSYSVSHDLRAPLRSMDGFSEILLRDNLSQLPPKAQRHLQAIRKNTQRMGMLIDDLLSFSQLNRQSLTTQTFEMEPLVRQALADLLTEPPDRQIEITIGDLGTCEGDRALLNQVWTNLLSNALKYTRKKTVPMIQVGCELIGGIQTYYIRDNGVGFDMQYYDKLFGVFQRFHRAEEYEGTGVGLAIVQRVIHRHGGEIWAESLENQGTVFYFTLGGNEPFKE